MKEVSSKAFSLFWKALEHKGLPPETMVAGTAVALATLQNKNERIDWAELLAILKNLRPHFTDDEYVELGRQSLQNPVMRFVFVVARLRFTPMGFFRWFNDPVKGPGNQIFTCIAPVMRELSTDQIEIDLVIKDGYAMCDEFFAITRGTFIEMPRLLGYPTAKVSMTAIPRGRRYHVTVPTKTSVLTAVRKTLLLPFTVGSVGRELQDAHESLQTRYQQVEAANIVVDQQRRMLDTAYQVGQRILSARDPATTASAIAHALVESAGFVGATLRVALDDSAGATEAIEQASAGASCDRPLRLDLSGGGRIVGELAVSPSDDADPKEAKKLLELLAPTIAIALDNAFAYRALATYQRGLEAKVEERTAQLSEVVHQLRDAQNARERFFGNISHEIRTPLTLIMLAVRDIEARAGRTLDARSAQNLGSVRDAAHKLTRLVDELLLLAAGQEGKLQLHREPTDVASLLEQLVAAWRPACEAAGLELAITTTALVANVDPVAFERVASNLVSNAVKYTPRGGRIELELASRDNNLSFDVRDTGPGIAPELAARLFGRFERGTNEQVTGTGIGLALVKQLVEAHGGMIVARPRAPHGTEMRVILPCAVTLAAMPVRALALAAPIASDHLQSGQRFVPEGRSLGTIVLAEDDPRIARATAELLSSHYTVIVGLDGAAALELVKVHRPQLLVTDVEMPRLDGLGLARAFREVLGDQLAPIIMLSALHDLGTRIAGLEAGAIDYITKPFEPRELVARVDAQFRMRELAIRLQQAEQLSTLGILTSGLAHELRNPANGIVNAIAPLVELLPAELVGPDTGPGQLLEVMAGCADQIRFLSKQLLGFRSGLQLEVAPASVAHVVRRSIGLAQDAIGTIEVRTQLTEDVEVACSTPLIVQALTNLIENAGHAAGQGGWIQVMIWVEAERIGVEVSDSGPGVPVAMREKIFQPFFTTKAPGEGAGLGLALARAIVQRHGGSLEVRDNPVGSAFVIELPRPAMRA